MGVTKRVVVDDFEDVEYYPVGTIVRAMHWGDVAVKIRNRQWKGSIPPSADQILNAPDDMWEENIHWAVAGLGGELVSCDGPFMVVYNPEEEVD